jgi:hypothetical protein
VCIRHVTCLYCNCVDASASLRVEKVRVRPIAVAEGDVKVD